MPYNHNLRQLEKVAGTAVKCSPSFNQRFHKAFAYSGLESISIPNSVFLIRTKVFDGCKNLKTVIIGNGIKTIGEEAFEDCSSLTTFNIGVEKLDADGFYIGMNWYNAGYGDDVFEGCSSLSLKELKKIRDTGYSGSF